MTALTALTTLKALAKAKPGKAQDLAEAALGAVAFPRHETIIPLPEDLTPDQRAVAEAIARRDDVVPSNWAMPPRAWTSRRWLGLAPGGVLERPVTFTDGARKRVPMWRALLVLAKKSEKRMGEFFLAQKLPLLERLEVFAEIGMDAYSLRRPPWGSASEITKVAGEWGRREAERAVTLIEKRHSKFVSIPDDLSTTILLALVRAKIPIAPRWDILLEPDPSTSESMREILRAIPEPRRSKTLAAWFKKTSTKQSVPAVTPLLPEFASVELTKAIVKWCERARVPLPTTLPSAAPKKVKKEKEKGPPIVLTCVRSFWPRKVADLTPKQRKQLEELGRAYDGENLSAAKRFGDGDAAHASSLQIREIADAKGKVAYESFTWLGDDGCIFEAGTTNEVASVVQERVECDDAALGAALEKAMTSRPRRGASKAKR